MILGLFQHFLACCRPLSLAILTFMVAKTTQSGRNSRRRSLVRFGLMALCSLWVLAAARAAEEKLPPLLLADKINYDDHTQVVVAIGHVELTQNDQVLRADKVTYDKTTDLVRATGNVAIVSQKTGEVLHAKQIEVTSDMKQGFIDQIGVFFPDNSRMIALDGQRYEGRYLIAQKGIYSACNLCAENPRAAPLWQLKAERITHDTEKKDIIYRDATVEIWGVPVFYTPYFAHPDPTVKRRQGFLAPVAGTNSTLGFTTRTPYYFDLAPNSDLVVAPTFSTKDYVQMAADWRHKFANGQMNMKGSFTKADYINVSGQNLGDRWRGHLFGNAVFNIDDNWRAGTDIAYASDKSYLPRYDIDADDILINRAYAERFSGRNYAVGDVYYFKDMRPNQRLIEPLVAPEIRVNALGEPGQTLGGRWSFNSGVLVTSRERDTDLTKQGASTRRFSMDMGWQRQLVSQTGFLTTVSGLARSDAYWADNVPVPGQPLGTDFKNISRLRPFAQGDVIVRYPMGRQGEVYHQILEPIALVSFAPRVSNSYVLPNEDSLDVEFDETNLFSGNRFTGIDRIEGGNRAAYGVRHGLYGKNGERVELLAGQVFRFDSNNAFTEGSGLREKFSDYVGRIDFAPTRWLDANYSFRLDQDDLSLTRQQLHTSVGSESFRPFINYLSLKQSEGTVTTDEQVEEVSGGFTAKMTEYWSFSAAHKQAINPAPGPRSVSAKLYYQDECFKSGISVERTFTSRADVDSGFRVLFSFYLKNIGGVNED